MSGRRHQEHRSSGGGRGHHAGHTRSGAPPATDVAQVLTLQAQAGNQAVAASIDAIQRRKPVGHVEVTSGEDMMGASALEGILYGRGQEELLNDLPPRARAAGDALWRCLHGRNPDGGYLPIEEQVTLYATAQPALSAMLDRALVAADGDYEPASHARRGLTELHTKLVATRAEEVAWGAGKAAELTSPKVKADRETMAAAARKGLDLYLGAEKALGATDIPGLTKDAREMRIKVLEGVIAICSTDDWPSYEKFRDDLDKQLARTDPDRVLGAGATVIEHIKKLSDWTIQSVTLIGEGMKSLLVMRGMLDEAARVTSALESLSKLGTAFAVLDVLHGTMVLLDSNANAADKIAGGLEVASGTVSIAGAVGGETIAAAAGELSPALIGATITYKSYKALAEYAFTSVVGGLSMVEVTNELEGDPIFAKKGMFRPNGLDDLALKVTEGRLRVESLMDQTLAAPEDQRAGVNRALDRQVNLLQNAVHALATQWSNAPLETLRAYMPPGDSLAWENAMSAQAEAFMVVDMAQRWEAALANAFLHRADIVNATMHATMQRH